MKTKYLVEHEGVYGSITVEIDHDFIDKDGKDMNAIINEMNKFWTDNESRLSDNGGDSLYVFLKRLCQRCMRILSEDELLATEQVVNSFISFEGWYPMDGYCGIKILDCVEPDFTTQHMYTINTL